MQVTKPTMKTRMPQAVKSVKETRPARMSALQCPRQRVKVKTLLAVPRILRKVQPKAQLKTPKLAKPKEPRTLPKRPLKRLLTKKSVHLTRPKGQ